VAAVAGPLIPSRVPPLPDRLHSLLLTLPLHRTVTVAQLHGWLSVPEDRKAVEQALASLAQRGLARRWPGRKPAADQWSRP
jgi:hypothetical protein